MGRRLGSRAAGTLKERLKNVRLVGRCCDLLYVDPIDLSSRVASVPTQTDGSLSRSWRGSSRAPSGPRTLGDGDPSLARCATTAWRLGPCSEIRVGAGPTRRRIPCHLTAVAQLPSRMGPGTICNC